MGNEGKEKGRSSRQTNLKKEQKEKDSKGNQNW